MSRLAGVQVATKDCDDAILPLPGVLAVQPNGPGARSALACAHVKSGDKAAGKKELDAIAKPEYPPALRTDAEKLLNEV